MFAGKCEKFSGEYALSETFLMKMHELHHSWNKFHPNPPLKRSDMMLLGNIVRLLEENDGKVTVSMLAKKMNQSMPGVSQKASALEEDGFVKRAGDKNDRRVTYISLTPKGQEMVQETLRSFMNRIQNVLEQLGPEKVDLAFEIMDELNDAFKNS